MNKVLSEIAELWPVVIIFISLVFVRMFITLFHEMGHAIAIFLITRGRVIIFLGTYGDRNKSIKITSGNFEIWLARNILKWKGGLCVPNARSITVRQNIIFTAAGPVASLVLSIILLSVYLVYQPEGAWAAFLFIFCVGAGLNFVYNMIPEYAAIVTKGGNLAYNDGAQLRALLDLNKSPGEYHDATSLFNEKRYLESAVIFEKLILSGTKNPEVFRKAVSAQMELGNYEKADEILKRQISKIGKLNTDDRMTLAMLKIHLGRIDEAIAYCKHLLQLYGSNQYNLNNLGHALNVAERYEEAIKYLDKAILIDNTFASAYCNRAYAKLKTGNLEGGKIDNDYSMGIDDTNSYAYRNSGVYFCEKWQYEEALTNFERAKELDRGTHLIDKYIIYTSNKLSERNPG